MGRIRVFSDDELRTCVAEGMTCRQIAEKFHCSKGAVYTNCKKLGLTLVYDMTIRNASEKHLNYVKSLEAKRERTTKRKVVYTTIREMRAQGSPYEDIASVCGVTKDYVIQYCQSHGLSYSAKEILIASGQYRDDSIVSENVRQLDRSVSYISGYVNKNSKMILRHDACGHIFEMSYHGLCLKPGVPVKCPVCAEEKRAAKRRQKIAKMAVRRTCDFCGKEFHPKGTHNRFCSKECAYQNQLTNAQEYRECNFVPEERICKYCGNVFTTQFKGMRDYCSASCRKKSTHDSTLLQRIKSKGQIINTDITLPKLYERDGGICYICGKTCDWNDKHQNSDGYWVYGNNYPSIDHVVPLAKMGTHSWDNVKLACRYCNSIKGADEVKEAV